MIMNKEILTVKNLSFEYSDVSVLRDVSFSVNKGDFLGIIGSNGAGKSTLLKLILGLLPYKNGQILINGEDIKKKKPDVGYVSQKANSFNTGFPATVGEVVMSGLKKRTRRVSNPAHPLRICFANATKRKLFSRYTDEDRKHLKDCLARVGMTEYKDKLIGKLSGGQQQRAFIARALIGGSDILILDEPTVGIDAMSVKEIMKLISDINKQGTTVIMTCHDTPTLVAAANKLLIFCEHGNGELIERNQLSLDEIGELYAGKRRHHHA